MESTINYAKEHRGDKSEKGKAALSIRKKKIEVSG